MRLLSYTPEGKVRLSGYALNRAILINELSLLRNRIANLEAMNLTLLAFIKDSRRRQRERKIRLITRRRRRLRLAKSPTL